MRKQCVRDIHSASVVRLHHVHQPLDSANRDERDMTGDLALLTQAPRWRQLRRRYRRYLRARPRAPISRPLSAQFLEGRRREKSRLASERESETCLYPGATEGGLRR